jgi:hypothetical protein
VKFSHALIVAAAFGSVALAADPGLLSLVMPDAKVVSGIQAVETRNSLFGQYLLSHLQANDANLNNFITQTGFDPRSDVSEMILASNGDSSTPQHQGLVLIKGVFNVSKMTAAAQANGGTITTFDGVDILTYPARGKQQLAHGIAFLDPSTAILGDVPSVEAVIQRGKTKAPPSSALLDKVAQVSINNDFWFVTLAPISQFAAALPDPNLSSALNGNVLAAINQLSGGVRFGDTVTISLEAVARTDKDAQALADVLKFAASLVQLNSQNNPASAQIAALLNTLDSRTAGNTTTISLAVPEQQLEQLLATLGPQGHPIRRRADRRSNGPLPTPRP